MAYSLFLIFTGPAMAQNCVDNPAFNTPNPSEHFESLDIGDEVTASLPDWVLYPESNGRAFIENSTMGTGKALHITDSSDPRSDVLYNLGLGGNRRWRLSWRMRVEPGRRGYYNIQYADSNPYDAFAYQVIFGNDGIGGVFIGVNDSPLLTFNFTPGQETKVVQIIDLAKDVAELYINDNYVGSWTYSGGFPNGQPTNRIGSINFWGVARGDFQVDDICVYQPIVLVTCQGLEDLVELKNGTGTVTRCQAILDLYTEGEWIPAVNSTVCDFGGDLIFRGRQNDGRLTASERAPRALELDPDVQGAFASREINISNGLVADIYTFYKEPDGQISIAIDEIDSRAIGFVFVCEPGPGGQTQQRLLGTFAEFEDDREGEAPEGIYYIVVASPVPNEPSQEQTYEFFVFPGGACDDQVTSLGLTEIISDDLFFGNENFSVANNYAACYSGSRSYEGLEKVYSIEVPEAFVSGQVTLTSDAKLGVFLFGDVCGITCLDFAEIPEGSNEVTLFLPSGLASTYFLVVDSEADEPIVDFDIGISGAFFMDNLLNTGTFQYDNSVCIIPLTNTHQVTLDGNSFNYQAGDVAFFTFENEAGRKAAIALEDAFWLFNNDPTDIDLFIPPNDANDPKCSYETGDVMSLSLVREISPSNFRLLEFTINYAQVNPPGVLDQGLFRPNGRSQILNLVEAAAPVNFDLVNSGELNLNNTASRTPFPLITGVAWEVEVTPPSASSWLTTSVNSGTGPAVINVDVTANPDPVPRRATMFVRSTNTDPLVQDSVVITQAGICISSAQNQTENLSACPGEDLVLGATLSQYDTAFFDYVWTRQIGNQSTELARGKVPTIQVTISPTDAPLRYIARVEDPDCGGFFEATFNVDVAELPTAGQNSTVEFCFNESLPTLTESLPNNAGYTFDWFDQNDNIQAQGTATFTPSAAGTYYSQARSTSLQGCISESTNTYEVESTTPIDLTTDGPDGVCAGETATLTATANGGEGNLTYLWDGGLGNTATVTTPPLNSSMQFTVTVTDASTCSVQDQLSVGVFAAISTSQLDTDCSADLQSYTLELTANANQLTANRGTVTDLGNNRFRVADIPSGRNVNLVLTNTTTNCQLEQTVQAPDCSCPAVAVPTPESAQQLSYCAGSALPMLEVSTAAGITTDWYTAATGGQPVAEGSDTFQPTSPGNYYAEGRESVSGCPSGTRVEFTVDELANPQAVVPADTRICTGDLVELDGSGSQGTGNLTFRWRPLPNGPVQSGALLTDQPNADTDYRLEVTDANGCSDAATVRVEVGPALSASASVVTPIDCEGDRNGSIAVAPMSGTPPFAVEWSTGDTILELSNLPAGNYTVTVTDASTCVAGAMVDLSSPDRLQLDSVSSQPAMDNASNDGSAELIFTGGTLPYSIEWSTADGNLGGELSSPDGRVQIDSLPSGNYELQMTIEDAVGCTLSTAPSFEVGVVVGLEVIDWPAGVRVYPNPFDRVLIIESEGPFSNPIRFQLLNPLGQVVAERIVDGTLGRGPLQWPIPALPSGMYALRLIDGERQAVLSLVKL